MVLVFDVGATNTRLALVDRGVIGEVKRFDTDKTAAGLGQLLGALEETAAGHRLEAVAGGLPGQIDEATGVVSHMTNLPDWNGLPVRERVGHLLGCPVFLGNDAVLCGLGEAQSGAGSKEGVMAYFTVSTGVNAVRLVDGKVDETISGYDIGQQLVPGLDGRVSTLEELVGGKALEARRQVKPRTIADGRTWRAEEHHLAHGLYNTILHWRPELVVFGGSMMRDIDLKAVSEELQKLPPVVDTWPRLVRATLGDASGLHGALAWAKRRV